MSGRRVRQWAAATAIHPRDDTVGLKIRFFSRPTVVLYSFRAVPHSTCAGNIYYYIIMSVRLIITMCHRGRVNFSRVVNDRRCRPEMEKYNICCCAPRSLLLLEPRGGAAAGLIRSILYDLSFRNHLSSLGRGRPLQWVSTVRSSSAVTRLMGRVKKSYAEISIFRVLGPCCTKLRDTVGR